MDFIKRASETLSKSKLGNMYGHLFERTKATPRHMKIPPLAQDNNVLNAYSPMVSTDRNSFSALRGSRSAVCTNQTSLSDYLGDFLPSCDTSSDAGKMKFCLQYFASVQQLRVSLFHAECLEVDNCRLVTEVALVGRKGQTKRKGFPKKSVTKSNSVVFNECVYLKLKREDFTKLRLRIRLRKVPKRFRSAEAIGGVILLLDEVNLDLDTTVNVILSTPEANRQIINGKYIQISRDATIEEEVQHYMNEVQHTFPRYRPLFAWNLPNVEETCETGFNTEQ